MPDDVKTTIRVGDGPEIPIDLDNIDSPENDDAKAAIAEGIGDSIGRASEPGSNSGSVAADQLRLFIERIERLEEEKKAIGDDQREVYAEAKANGYDTKTMRAIVRLRKLETHARQEQDALIETYRNALGI